MINSLVEALNIDSTFFIQLLFFAVFYPVLSRGLFKPWYRLHTARESLTSSRFKKAEKLKLKKTELEQLYKDKVKEWDQKFQNLFTEKSDVIKKNFQEQRQEFDKQSKKMFFASQNDIHQDFERAKKEIDGEVKHLTDLVLEKIHS